MSIHVHTYVSESNEQWIVMVHTDSYLIHTDIFMYSTYNTHPVHMDEE